MSWHHIALSGKEAGVKEPLLPWHRSCVRSDVLCSPAGVDSCFHFSVPQALVQRLRVIMRKMNCFFCLLGVFLVPRLSSGLWHLSPHSWALNMVTSLSPRGRI